MPSSALEQLGVFGVILAGVLMIIGGFDLIDFAATREPETPKGRRRLTTSRRRGLVAVGNVVVVGGAVLPFIRGGFERTVAFFGLARDGWAVASVGAFVFASVIGASACSVSALRRIDRRRYRADVLDSIAQAAVADDVDLLRARIEEWLGERRELDLETLLPAVRGACEGDWAKARAVMGQIVERTFAAQEFDRKARARAAAEATQLAKSFAGGKVVLIVGYTEYLAPFVALDDGADVVVAVQDARIEVRRGRSCPKSLDHPAIARVIKKANEEIRRSYGCWMVAAHSVIWMPQTEESKSSVSPDDLAIAAVEVIQPLRSHARALMRFLREKARKEERT